MYPENEKTASCGAGNPFKHSKRISKDLYVQQYDSYEEQMNELKRRTKHKSGGLPCGHALPITLVDVMLLDARCTTHEMCMFWRKKLQH